MRRIVPCLILPHAYGPYGGTGDACIHASTHACMQAHRYVCMQACMYASKLARRLVGKQARGLAGTQEKQTRRQTGTRSGMLAARK